MRIRFSEEFEYKLNDQIYWVETEGEREWDYDGRIFTNLRFIRVTDELGNELDDTDDIYDDIQEHVLYDRRYEEDFEETGFNDYGDEEEIPYINVG